MSDRRKPRATKLTSYKVLQARLLRVQVNSLNIRDVRIRGRYVIPASSGPLKKTIVVQPGTSNLILRFARGSSLTTAALAPGDNQILLAIGTQGATDPQTSTSLIAAGIAANATTATLSAGTASPGWYFLQDFNRAENGRITAVGGELIRVASVAGSVVTFATPTTQAYASNANGGNTMLSAIPSPAVVCENIGIRGGKFSGFRSTNITTAPFSACIAAYYVAGLTVQRTQGKLSQSTIFTTLYSRDITMSRCSGAELAGAGNLTGEGYTFQFDRSVSITVRDCWAQDTRYGFVIERGSSKFLLSGIAARYCRSAAVDVHGGDAYDGTIDRVTALGQELPTDKFDQSIRLGNQTYKRGCDKVTITNSQTEFVEMTGAVRNSTWDGGKLSRVKIATTANDTTVGAPPGYPSVVTVRNCTITNPAATSLNVIEITGTLSPSTFRFVTVRFDNCTIIQQNTGQNLFKCPTIVTAASDLVIVGCYLQMDGNFDTMVVTGGAGEVGGVSIQWVGCNAELNATKKVAASNPASTLSSFLNSTNGGSTPNKRRASGGSYANLVSTDVSNLTWVPS